MNTHQFWTLCHLILEAEGKAEDAENAAAILYFSDLYDALSDLMPASKAGSHPRGHRKESREALAAEGLSSILQLSAGTREGLRPKPLPPMEGKVPQFGELRAAYRKALPPE